MLKASINLWTYDGNELVIKDLPGGLKIVVWENYISRKRRWYDVLLEWPMPGGGMNIERLTTTSTYSEAKISAEAYVEQRFAIWLVALTELRPPTLGVDIPHPDDLTFDDSTDTVR